MITKFISKSFATHKYMALRSQTFDIDKINKRLQEILKISSNQGVRCIINVNNSINSLDLQSFSKNNWVRIIIKQPTYLLKVVLSVGEKRI